MGFSVFLQPQCRIFFQQAAQSVAHLIIVISGLGRQRKGQIGRWEFDGCQFWYRETFDGQGIAGLCVLQLGNGYNIAGVDSIDGELLFPAGDDKVAHFFFHFIIDIVDAVSRFELTVNDF